MSYKLGMWTGRNNKTYYCRTCDSVYKSEEGNILVRVGCLEGTDENGDPIYGGVKPGTIIKVVNTCKTCMTFSKKEKNTFFLCPRCGGIYKRHGDDMFSKVGQKLKDGTVEGEVPETAILKPLKKQCRPCAIVVK